MLRLPARLPDPLVGLLPDLGGARRLGLHDRPQAPRQPLAPARVQEDRIEGGAEDVVLPLVERPVPDPDGMGARIAGEVVPGRFGQVATAVDPVHDLQPAVRVRLEVGDELHEFLRLPVEVEEVERLQRERRVPDPGEPVVPVAFAARGLGQRCRQRRHGRPRRHVREALDRQGGALDRFAPTMVGDARPAEPGAPEPDGRRDPGLGVVDVARGLQFVGPRQGAVRAVAGVQDVTGSHAVALDAQRQVRPQPEHLIAARGVGDPVVPVPEAPRRRDLPVVEDRLAHEFELDLPVQARDRSNEHVIGVVVGRWSRMRGDVSSSLARVPTSARRARPPIRSASSTWSRARWSPARRRSGSAR